VFDAPCRSGSPDWGSSVVGKFYSSAQSPPLPVIGRFPKTPLFFQRRRVTQGRWRRGPGTRERRPSEALRLRSSWCGHLPLLRRCFFSWGVPLKDSTVSESVNYVSKTQTPAGGRAAVAFSRGGGRVLGRFAPFFLAAQSSPGETIVPFFTNHRRVFCYLFPPSLHQEAAPSKTRLFGKEMVCEVNILIYNSFSPQGFGPL